jgi:serine protease
MHTFLLRVLLTICVLPAALVEAHGQTAPPPGGNDGNVLTRSGNDDKARTRSSSDGNARAWSLIGLDKAAHFAAFRRPVKVAIIDDGFDLDNPLWAASIAHNTADIPGNNVDDDHNGKIDDYEGWDFGDNDEDVRPLRNVVDKESHGTRVLGVFWQVLQELSNGAPTGISILPIKAVADGRLNNYLMDGYKGIEYALEQKADVIICSWSGPQISAEEKTLLSKAQARGVLIIAAAGNFYSLQPLYPGAFPAVINVAATDAEGHKLAVSNYGTFVDISAPGDSLLTYDPYGHTPTAHLSATSAATPVVAAVVTAIRAAWPGLTPAAIERLLKNTATPLEGANPLYAGELGAGMVNVAAIRDALMTDGATAGATPGAIPAAASGASATAGATPGATGNATAGANLFSGPQGYVDLRRLQAASPVKIVPTGRYPAIKFLLQPSAYNTVAGVRLTLFRDGQPRDTVVRGANLKYPFLAVADSLYLYSMTAATHPAHGGAASVSAVRGSTTVHGSAAASAGPWWYYQAMPIDSSTFYCGSTVNIAAGSEGTLEDGSGGANYTGRNDCKWQLTAPAGKKIQLSFEQFDTEPKIDQVYIFSGNSTKDPILAIFSGHKLPPVIKSWNENVLIWFVTNEENNFQGWRLHYKVVD